MNALVELMSIATPDNSAAAAFAGYCQQCGTGMYKRGHKQAAAGSGWSLAALKTTCTKCYKRDWRRKQGHAERPKSSPQCSKCERLIRSWSQPADTGKVRQTVDLCSTCYRKSKPAECPFTHCSVCRREIGSPSAHGGIVRPGGMKDETCRTCQWTANFRRRRKAQTPTGAGTGRAHTYTFGEFR